MFKCTVWVDLPLTSVTGKAKKSEGNLFLLKIATFAFDPNLQVGDTLNISDWELGMYEKFNFTGEVSVTERKVIIQPNKQNQANSVLEVRIIVEILDKKQIQDVCLILEELDPGILRVSN